MIEQHFGGILDSFLQASRNQALRQLLQNVPASHFSQLCAGNSFSGLISQHSMHSSEHFKSSIMGALSRFVPPIETITDLLEVSIENLS
jgi:hypothetical protein